MARPADLPKTATGWELRGSQGLTVRGVFLAPWSWKFTRGASPYITEILSPDARFAALSNPVRLTLECPNRNMSAIKKVHIENLWIVEHQRTFLGLYRVAIADARWALNAGSLTRSYNIVSYGGQLREGTGRGGGPSAGRWAIADAVVDAIFETHVNAGGVLADRIVVINSRQNQAVRNTKLPDNLGNSVGGGWASAKPDEFLPAMLGDFGDLTITRGGWASIVDRTDEKVKPRFRDFMLLSGVDGAKEVHWQQPKVVYVKWPQRLGMQLRIIKRAAADGGNAQATAAIERPDPTQLQLAVENVFPEPQTSGTDTTADEPDVFITDSAFYARAPSPGLTDQLVRERLLAKVMIPAEDLTAPQRALAALMEQLTRMYWRRLWRIVDGEGEVRRAFADLRLGRLNADGTTNPATVRMDHVNLFRYQRFSSAPMSQSLEGKAPFIARWMEREGLIFQVIENGAVPLSVAATFPGKLIEEISFPTLKDITSDEAEVATQATAKFAEDFGMVVHMHGLYVGGSSEFGRGRMYETNREAFPGGDVPFIEVRGTGLTANWERTELPENGGVFQLLNEQQLEDRTDEIVSEIVDSYKQRRAGVLTFSGLDVLDHVAVEGDIHEISITIGEGGPLYEMRTVVEIRPGLAPELVAAPQPALSNRIL